MGGLQVPDVIIENATVADGTGGQQRANTSVFVSACPCST